jgi:hypothetical protein
MMKPYCHSAGGIEGSLLARQVPGPPSHFFVAGKHAMQDRKRRRNAKARFLWKRAFMSLSSTPENGFF